jgi:NTP pyrophosphatase (non-canonical NTP hydrolase)
MSVELASLVRAVRKADAAFERSGGGTRAWVRDCLLQALVDEGIEVRRKCGGNSPMDFDDFTKSALRTWDGGDTYRDQLANAALGLAGESGEAADLIKKHLFHGHALDTAKIRSELGDVLYYVAILANGVGLTLEEITEANSAKLKERYPEGFDPERSKNRPEPTPWGYPDNASENQ